MICCFINQAGVATDQRQCAFKIGVHDRPADVLVGEIGVIPFFMNGEQYKLWKHAI